MPGLAIAVVTLIAYFHALNAGYIWDDDAYLTKNALLVDPQGLRLIWTPGNTPQYYPAVFTTFWIERHIWGLNPAGYHAVNVALHALNALLVWRLCRSINIPGAWFIGAVFAVHPVEVESVAWITERKNVLSTCFYLLSALAFLRFQDQHDPALRTASSHPLDRRRSTPRPATMQRQRAPHPWLWYSASVMLFVVALLAKTVTCSLPVALLLVMLWQRKGVTIRRLLPLVPMITIGLVLALHTAHLERTQVGATGPDFDFSMAERVLIASNALLFYPWKMLVPWPLMFIYPRWHLDASSLGSYWPVAAVALITGLAVIGYVRGTRGPALAIAFFAVTIFPALGFFNVYPMRYSFVADHFQYLASLGLIALVVGGSATLASNKILAGTVGAAAVLVLAVRTSSQCSMYRDEETLWRTTVEQNPGAWIAHSNLAKLLSERGDNAEALEQIQRALPLTTSAKAVDQIRLNAAITLAKLGRYQDALDQYQQLQLSIGGMDVKLAQMLERLGRDGESEAMYRAALETRLRSDALVPFSLQLLRRGRPGEAVEWLELFVKTHPDDDNAQMFLADAYAAAGRPDDAIASGERALELARVHGHDRMATLIRERLGEYRAVPRSR